MLCTIASGRLLQHRATAETTTAAAATAAPVAEIGAGKFAGYALSNTTGSQTDCQARQAARNIKYGATKAEWKLSEVI